MKDKYKTKEQLIKEMGQLRKQLAEAEGAKKEFDPLTGLPNRFLLYDRLSQSLLDAQRNGKVVALMFLCIDDFKLINDNFGHSVGNRLLKEISERLVSCLRKIDTVARPGRDEFIILLPEITRARDTIVVAEKILGAFEKPFSINKHEIFVQAQIGISLYLDEGLDADAILKHSYTALNSAKKKGKNRYEFFSQQVETVALKRLTLINSLQQALKRNEFLLHYQPQVSLSTGKIVGMEALLQWRRPGAGIVPPMEFIPLAEETGLIIPIGEWGLRTACKQHLQWQKKGFAPERIAVNLSARQFQGQDIIGAITKVLQETGFDPTNLELELTESLVFQNEGETISKLVRLKDMGINISIDDFGTGHSSFAYLRQFPVGKLKIVGSFVRSISKNPADSAIAKLLVDMSHLLGMRVLAEGVETKGQLDLLSLLGCDEIQGFFFSKPLPAEAATEMLSGKYRLLRTKN